MEKNMIREISSEKIVETVAELFREACVCPPKEVIDAFAAAKETEVSQQGREIFCQLIENAAIANETKVPYCQDTGMAVVLMDIGQDVHITGDLTDAVNEGVRKAYTEGYFRKSVLSALGRVNTGDNTPAVLHTRIVPGDKIEITALPKGFGSENMSKIKMFPPSAGIDGIKDFIVETAAMASANPCPPVIIGVGIGGTFEYAAMLSKRQLARKLGEPSSDPVLAEMEEDIKNRINALGMGPMALGGRNYCLAVHIAEYPTHIAGLPVAVNYCCHALRHASATI